MSKYENRSPLSMHAHTHTQRCICFGTTKLLKVCSASPSPHMEISHSPKFSFRTLEHCILLPMRMGKRMAWSLWPFCLPICKRDLQHIQLIFPLIPETMSFFPAFILLIIVILFFGCKTTETFYSLWILWCHQMVIASNLTHKYMRPRERERVR